MEELKAKLRSDFQRTRRMLDTVRRFELLPVGKKRKGKKKLMQLINADEDVLARNYIKELEGAIRRKN